MKLPESLKTSNNLEFSLFCAKYYKDPQLIFILGWSLYKSTLKNRIYILYEKCNDGTIFMKICRHGINMMLQNDNMTFHDESTQI